MTAVRDQAKAPPRFLIRTFWALHRSAYRLTRGRFGLKQPEAGERFGFMRLHTVGRRSGKARVAIIGYYEDGPNLVTLAMNGWGTTEPAWWLNLQATPETTVQLADGPRAVRARAATESERERLWHKFADYPGWGDDLPALAARRPGETAIVVLEPRAGTGRKSEAIAADGTEHLVRANASDGRRLRLRHLWLVPGLALAIVANQLGTTNGLGILALIAFGIAPDVPRLLGSRGRPLHNLTHHPIVAATAVSVTAVAATATGVVPVVWIVASLIWFSHVVIGRAVGDVPRGSESRREAAGTKPPGDDTGHDMGHGTTMVGSEHAGHDMSAGTHDRHAGHSVAMFRDKFWLSFALTIPVVFLSPEVAHWLGYMIPAIPLIEYLPAILGTVIFLYGGLVFIRGAQGELADRKPGMMTLISLAIIVAFVTSWAGTLGFFEVEIWWELATLITIMLLGHWLEMRSIAQAQGALAALAALLPDTAERVTADGTEEVPISALQMEDVVLVRPGARVPADGLIVDGMADVDESMITGESRAIPKQVGDEVIAGTVAAGGSLRVKVTATGDQTALSGIMRLVAQAQASASRTQALADRAAALLFYVALVAGAITLVGWWLLGDPEGALVRTVTVLVIACPHALGLAIPLVIAISTSLGARNGLLIKDRLALERARTLDTVIFDKTGTLTKGEPILVDVAAGSMDVERVLGLAASVEADSEHPLARAIVDGAKQRGIETRPASEFEALAGRGAHAKVHGHDVFVGGPRLLQEQGLTPHPQAADWDQQGRTVLHVVVDGGVAGIVAVEDEIRPESKEAIDALHRLGVRVAIITGDSQAVADSVARRLGIDEVAAQVLPADKAAAVKRFQEGGRKVAMVGDGVNDAPALATADVGIAIGAGTDVAVESAGIVLVRSDPRDVVGAIELSRATYNKMIQNLVWATGYNLVAIPVAMGIFVPWGIDISMAAGAIAMSLSTIIVAANAQLLRRLKLDREPPAPPPSARLAPA